MNRPDLFKKHYPELDLLRTFAIILVMLRHFGKRGFDLPDAGMMTHFIMWGAMGVVLFFVLSGFLIGGQIMEEVERGEFSFYRFYFKRFWRIFPPYYFSIFVVVVLYFLGFADSNVVRPGVGAWAFLKDAFYHVLYLQNYLSLPKIQGTLYWTLGIEEQFYVVIPLIIFAVLMYIGRGVTGLLASVVVIDLVVRHLLFDAYGGDLGSFKLPFYTYFTTLIMGVLSARVFIRHRDRLRGSRALRLALLAGGLAALWMSLVVGGEAYNYFNVCWKIPFTGVAFSAIMVWMVSADIGWAIRPGRFFSAVAKLSYTMYLYHLALLFPVVELSTRYWGVASFADFYLVFAFYFVAVVAVSAAVYHLIDRPCMSYRRRALRRMASPAGADGGTIGSRAQA